MAQIFDRLESRKIVCIEGDRRIGKSSLLFQLCHQFRGSEGEPRFHFSYIDLQQFRDGLTAELFWQQMADTLARFAGGAGPTEGARDSLEAAGKRVRELGRRAVLLLDEFDLVAVRPDFDADFYASLHSLCERYPITVLATTRFPLRALSQVGGLPGLSLATHFDCVHLGPLDEREAKELIGMSAERTGISLNPYADWIIQAAGLRPFYLQMACAAAFDVLSENPGANLSEDEAERRFLQEALPHCRYQFSTLWPAEQEVLNEVAQGGQPASLHPEIRSRLILDGYLTEGQLGLQVSSRMLQVFLTRRPEPEGETPGLRPRQRLSSGSSIAQHVIREVVTSDAMGYLCHTEDQRAGGQAALRVIDSSALGGVLDTELLVDQARQAGSLSHPAIAAPYDVSCLGGLVLIAVRWLPGNCVRDLLGTGPREWWQLVRWLASACEGLAAAHREGMVHRNLKPSNLFVRTDGKVQILDFGVPRHHQLMRSLSLGGALSSLQPDAVQYLSPEQACAEPADHRSDLFSVGVILHEGLTGRSPFLRASVGDTLRAILNDDPPMIQLEEENASREVNEVVLKLLEKRPSLRYQNAKSLAADLQKLFKSRKHSRLWFR